jgi:ankyrin repeat protein
VHNNEVNEARQLLESGEVPDERSGNEMLGRALHHSSFEMAQLLIDFGVNVNYTNRYGYALLHQIPWFTIAVPSNDPGVQAETNHRHERVRSKVALLVKAGADVLLTDKEGWNVLHRASYTGHVEVVRWLLEDADKLADEKIGVDIFAKTDAGETAQHLAKLNTHHRANANAPHHQIVALLESAARQPKCVAFAMGLHPRLGVASTVNDFKPELLRMVLELVLDRE